MSSFGNVLREFRIRLMGKQLTLAVSVGCTEAAISFWESDRRLPSPRLLALLVKRLTEAGASPDEVRELVTVYRTAIADRRTEKFVS